MSGEFFHGYIIGWAIVQHNDDMSYSLIDKGVNIFQDGVADLHCRSDRYLADEIYREYTEEL